MIEKNVCSPLITHRIVLIISGCAYLIYKLLELIVIIQQFLSVEHYKNNIEKN